MIPYAQFQNPQKALKSKICHNLVGSKTQVNWHEVFLYLSHLIQLTLSKFCSRNLI